MSVSGSTRTRSSVSTTSDPAAERMLPLVRAPLPVWLRSTDAVKRSTTVDARGNPRRFRLMEDGLRDLAAEAYTLGNHVATNALLAVTYDAMADLARALQPIDGHGRHNVEQQPREAPSHSSFVEGGDITTCCYVIGAHVSLLMDEEFTTDLAATRMHSTMTALDAAVATLHHILLDVHGGERTSGRAAVGGGSSSYAVTAASTVSGGIPTTTSGTLESALAVVEATIRGLRNALIDAQEELDVGTMRPWALWIQGKLTNCNYSYALGLLWCQAISLIMATALLIAVAVMDAGIGPQVVALCVVVGFAPAFFVTAGRAACAVLRLSCDTQHLVDIAGVCISIAIPLAAVVPDTSIRKTTRHTWGFVFASLIAVWRQSMVCATVGPLAFSGMIIGVSYASASSGVAHPVDAVEVATCALVFLVLGMHMIFQQIDRNLLSLHCAKLSVRQRELNGLPLNDERGPRKQVYPLRQVLEEVARDLEVQIVLSTLEPEMDNPTVAGDANAAHHLFAMLLSHDQEASHVAQHRNAPIEFRLCGGVLECDALEDMLEPVLLSRTRQYFVNTGILPLVCDDDTEENQSCVELHVSLVPLLVQHSLAAGPSMMFSSHGSEPSGGVSQETETASSLSHPLPISPQLGNDTVFIVHPQMAVLLGLVNFFWQQGVSVVVRRELPPPPPPGEATIADYTAVILPVEHFTGEGLSSLPNPERHVRTFAPCACVALFFDVARATTAFSPLVLPGDMKDDAVVLHGLPTYDNKMQYERLILEIRIRAAARYRPLVPATTTQFVPIRRLGNPSTSKYQEIMFPDGSFAALKVVRPKKWQQETLLELSGELSSKAQLRHINLVNILTIESRLSSDVCVFFELCCEVSLRLLLSYGALPAHAAAEVTYAVLCAVDYLSKNGSFAGDIRSQNILFGSMRLPKLRKFGCRTCDVRWRAPEFASTPPSTITEFLAADIWSLGCMQLEMMYGGSYAPESLHRSPEGVGVPPAQNEIQEIDDAVLSATFLRLPIHLDDSWKSFTRACFTHPWQKRATLLPALLAHPFVAQRSSSSTAKGE